MNQILSVILAEVLLITFSIFLPLAKALVKHHFWRELFVLKKSLFCFRRSFKSPNKPNKLIVCPEYLFQNFKILHVLNYQFEFLLQSLKGKRLSFVGLYR